MQLKQDNKMERIPAHPICVVETILQKRYLLNFTLISCYTFNFKQVKPAFLTEISFYGQGSHNAECQLQVYS